MALADVSARDRQASPTNGADLSLNLPSNNPFRNRTTSPSPQSPNAKAQDFPFPNMSKNPFLDPAQSTANTKAVNGDNSTFLADDIFKDLSLLDKPVSDGQVPSKAPPPRPGGLPSQHRPMASDDRRGPPRGPPRGPDSPPKRPDHRRRASESSMVEFDRRVRSERDRSERPPRTESEERRRRERRREREERHRQEKERIRNGEQPKPRSRRPKHLDIIDKLDHTGIYGQGLFHHDGPFDACNPNRNKGKGRPAPMQAFPEGSMNMALGGAGPLHSRIDLDRFHGRNEDAFADYSTTRKADTAYANPQERVPVRQPQYFNPTERIEQVHGVESYGLGTSTFLEGAPASKRALQRRESEEQATAEEFSMGGGLQRKKSLAQRLRGMSNSRPRNPNGQVRSPEARYNNDYASPTPSEMAPIPVKAVSAGGPTRAVYTRENEINPFDNEYDKAFEKKGAEIKFVEQERPTTGRARAPSSPKANGLTRSVTADAAARSPTEEEKPSFLTRMKSLKGGGRRARPERKDSSSAVN